VRSPVEGVDDIHAIAGKVAVIVHGKPELAEVDVGSVQRFRPVVLTSITTFIRLLPIQITNSLQAQFVKPIAISIGFGVLFATFVTLLLVPVLSCIGGDIQRLLAGAELKRL
jgi:Cu/Ag efflux pump CusA